MSAQENEALVRRYFEEVWGKGNLAAVDEFIAPNYVEHSVPHGSQPGRGTLKQYVAMYHNTFPDVKCTLHDILAQGDRVAYRWSASGTHLGEWAGIPPTGNHMMATGITIGFPRLRALIAERSEEVSVVAFLMDELRSYVGEGWEQEDDITLVTLRRSAQ